MSGLAFHEISFARLANYKDKDIWMVREEPNELLTEFREQRLDLNRFKVEVTHIRVETANAGSLDYRDIAGGRSWHAVFGPDPVRFSGVAFFETELAALCDAGKRTSKRLEWQRQQVQRAEIMRDNWANKWLDAFKAAHPDVEPNLPF